MMMYKTEDQKRGEFTSGLLDAAKVFGNFQEFKSRLEKADQMFETLCPFSVGDRVEISRELNIGEGSGWRGSKHFLVPGAVGTVKDRGWFKDRFYFTVQFDDETWIDPQGVEHLPSSPSGYTLGAKSLKIHEFGQDFWRNIWS